MRYGFGVDVGGTTVKIAWFDAKGTLLEKWEIPTVVADGGKAILPDVAASIQTFLEKKQVSREQIIGIGLGVPGPVDQDGVVNECHNLGWGVFNVREALEALTGFRVRVGNDANMAALGEAWKGGGAGSENSVMVTLGTGVGGGIILDGHVYSGGLNCAGAELGHIVIVAGGRQCGCGRRGCWEAYSSATALTNMTKEKMRELELKGIPSLLFDEAKREGKVSARTAFNAMRGGDEH